MFPLKNLARKGLPLESWDIEFILGNMKIYLHFLSFLDSEVENKLHNVICQMAAI